MPICGIVGLGRLLSEGNLEFIEVLRNHASDSRWRIREAVAIALQKYGDNDIDNLLVEMEKWRNGNLFEKRAVVATLCEPRLLKKPEHTEKVYTLLDQITKDLIHETNRKSESFISLRKALAYCWSVAVVANPKKGIPAMSKWLMNQDNDIRWIMRENLKKNRLRKLDADWTEKWLYLLQ